MSSLKIEEIRQEPFTLKGKTVLGRALFTPPFKVNSPLTDEARFVYVVNGHSRLHSPTGNVELQSGDNMVMKCDNFVNHWQSNEDGSTSEIIIFQFFPEIMNFIYDGKLPEQLNHLGTDASLPIVNIGFNDLLSGFVLDMRRYFAMSNIMTDEFLQIKIRELIHLLASLNDPKVNAFLRKLFQSRHYQFQEVIDANLYENLRIEELAFLCGLSVSSFQRKFKDIYQTSPKQYILSKRLEKARHLLQKTQMSVSEIAYDCGFEDAGHFSKSFSANFKISPRGLRDSLD